MGISFQYDEAAYNYSAASEILPWIIQLFNPSSLLDVGCGTGTWLKVARDLGVKEILGVDGAVESKSLLKIPESMFMEKDLREPLQLNKKYDLVICIEVGEHLPAESADVLVQSLCNHGDTILFSAAIPGQGGQNHINEQWPEYWSDLFRKNGFYHFDILRPIFWQNENIDFWYRQNMMLYSKHRINLGESVNDFNSLPIVHPGLLKDKLARIRALENELKTIRNATPGIKASILSLIKAVKSKF